MKVQLRAFTRAFAPDHGPLVRPGFQALWHQRELDARQVHAHRLIAHAGAPAAPYLQAKAGTRPFLEA